ncbi:protein-ribulosamine 3-kinase [Acrasis kona]|uniref:protein-ribulosamine 3-kinase n=1 Tax=Acrasis kona TaxID=1008807 RepID=A0AAW2Z331_9EUKA
MMKKSFEERSVLSERCNSIEEAIRTYCKASRIDDKKPISGGCISRAYRVGTDVGTFFVKVNGDEGAYEMFQSEMEGLQVMYNTKTIRVPKPICCCQSSEGALLVLENIEMSGRVDKKIQVMLGEQIANLHQCHGDSFGFSVNNTIGSTPQINVNRSSDWVDFFVTWRLKFQLDLLMKNHHDEEVYKEGIRLSNNVIKFFPKELIISPSFLHGDLWGGNVGVLQSDQIPVIFDPACYYGHHEAELSIMTMFGGFDSNFFESYHKKIPKFEMYFKERQQLYQLYHYLNHYNMFGSGYRGSCVRIIQSLLKVVDNKF